MLTTALASLRYHKARLALSSLAIVLGIAFLAGTLTLSASMNQAFYASFAAGARNVSAIVASHRSGNPPGQAGGQTLPRSVLAEVRAVPGVAAAAGRLTGPAALIGRDRRVIGSGLGINIAPDPALRGFTVASGHLPAAPDQVAVDTATAADEHLRLGQAVRVVEHTGATRAFRLVATISLGVNSQIGNASVVAFQTPVAISVTGQIRYGLIAARATPGLSQAALAARIRARPALRGYLVQTGSQLATEEANSALHAAQVLTAGILVFALVALVVAAIVVANTFSILITQRGRELALLRCVGATRRQVFAGAMTESLLAGLAASAVGVLVGVGLSWGLARLLTALHAASVAIPLTVPPSAAGLSMAAGLAVTMAAAVLPARAATRIAPVAALGGQDERPVTARAGWSRGAVAIGGGAAGTALTYVGTQHVSGESGFAEIAAGGCVCFVAVLAAGPLIVSPVIAALGGLGTQLVTRRAAVTVRLATANARRNPHRVAATTAALTIGITLMTLFTVVVSSVRASADAALQGHFPFDYVVQAGPPGQPVPPRILRGLQASPRLRPVAAVYARAAQVDGRQVPLGGYGPGALGGMIRPAMVTGALAAVRSGAAAVDSGALRLLGTRAGGTIVVSTPDAGRERLRVVAVYRVATYRSPLPPVIISAADYQRGFRPAGPDQVIIDAAPGVPAAASRAAVTAATAGDPALTTQTLADYKASLDRGVDEVLAIVGALLGLAILIALLGVSNTLTLSVIERTRESALMRALGLTRGQLRGTLLAEALLMAALAAVLGTALGATFGAAMMHALSRSVAGRAVLSIPYAQLGLLVLILVASAGAAAVLPARRAARASVVAAMAQDC